LQQGFWPSAGGFKVHIPDGYINLATSAGAGVAAAGGLGVALKASGKNLADRQIPLAGLAAAFIFALQMLNFPVAAGTSGHLLGGALAAILLGPWLGVVVVAVVVIVQALIFADGGISALGLNVLNMAVITAPVGWAVFRGVMRIAPRNTASVLSATALAGWVSMLVSSLAFVVEYGLGGQGGVPLATVFAAMTGVHAIIGIGEGLISAVVVGAVLAVRPDLVRATAGLEVSRTRTAPSPRALGSFVLAGIVSALLLVLVVAPLASADPDGLERVAADTGFAATAEDHPLGGPLADYGVAGIESERTGTIVAGAIGVVVTFGVGLGLIALARRRTAA
jgi:cobalt/nickel transport system permease protein